MTRLERLAAALVVVTTRPPIVVASTPASLRNPLNGRGLGVSRGARMASNARRRTERRAGGMLATRLSRDDGYGDARICVVLTRISPRAYDDDGTTAALKSVRDGMAEAWGIDDADPRVTWVCDWRKGKHHVVEAALWVIPERTAIPAGTTVDVTTTGGPVRWVPAPSQPIDLADIRSDSRKPVISPAYIRAKGGL